jgi:transposase
VPLGRFGTPPAGQNRTLPDDDGLQLRMMGLDLRHEANGTLPNIPPKADRVWKPCFSPVLYRARNAIERMFCRLKDFRRIATRYDRLATTFLAAVCLAATVSYWL